MVLQLLGSSWEGFRRELVCRLLVLRVDRWGGGSEVGNNTGCGLHNKTSGWNGVSVIYLLK